MGKHDLSKKDIKNQTFSNVHLDKNQGKKKKGKKSKHKIFKIFLFILLILLIVFIIKFIRAPGNTFLSKILGAMLGHDEETLKNLDKLQVLILGESTGMSDTIIVASYDPKTSDAALMTIPRDTFTGEKRSSAKYYNKINSLYGYGETPEKTVAAVNKITGLELENYIIVDTEALIKLVDLIGGLYFDVPIDMDYDDPSQDLYIHLSKGYQKLSGEQVEQLVRFRHNNNGSTYPYEYGIEDHGRSKTQRNVIIALAKQTLTFDNISNVSKIVDILKDYVDTNMDLDSIKDYIPYAVQMDMDSVKVGRIPGEDAVENGVWFFFHDEEGTKELVDELFNGVTSGDEAENGNEITDNSQKDDE